MSSIIRRRRGLMGVSVMGGLPEIGLNTQSSDSSPLSVTALLIAPGTPLRAALYRESGLVLRRVSPLPVWPSEGRFFQSTAGRSGWAAGTGLHAPERTSSIDEPTISASAIGPII